MLKTVCNTFKTCRDVIVLFFFNKERVDTFGQQISTSLKLDYYIPTFEKARKQTLILFSLQPVETVLQHSRVIQGRNSSHYDQFSIHSSRF